MRRCISGLNHPHTQSLRAPTGSTGRLLRIFPQNRVENFPELNVLRGREFPPEARPITLEVDVFYAFTVPESSPDDLSHERN